MDCEEGLTTDNTCTYEVIPYKKLNSFPYCLIGKLTSYFGNDLIKSGVGILIGPSVVLTAAHNLLLNSQAENGKKEKAYKISFCPSAHGDFEPFEKVFSDEIYISEQFMEGISNESAAEQLKNDWALVYLQSPIGNTITSILNIGTLSYFKVNERGLYSYFIENKNQNLQNLVFKSPEISIVGYTEQNLLFHLNNKGELYYTDINGKSKDSQSREEDNDININIKISTKEEGLIGTSTVNKNMIKKPGNLKVQQRSFAKATQKEKAMDNLKYIILHEQDIENAIQKVVGNCLMTESKGKLENFNEELKYKISTYKGQSGSPIFLRIPKFEKRDYSDFGVCENDLSKDTEYLYIFIGLHSRRGPLVSNIKSYVKNLNDINSNIVETSVSAIPRNVNTPNISSNRNIETTEEEAPKMNDLDPELIKVHGICEFNQGISIVGSGIIDAINQSVNSRKLSIENKSSQYGSNFKLVAICLNGKEKILGMFQKNNKMEIFFDFASKILPLKKEYIVLNVMVGKKERKINYNYDQDKLLELYFDEDSPGKISLEVDINIMKYGEELGKKVLNKYCENECLDRKKLSEEFERHMKDLFSCIFDEISSFQTIHPTFGKLFSMIRTHVLRELNKI